MPRRAISGSAGVVFHVLNRGARRMRLFDSDDDYYAFLSLLGRAQRRVPMALFGYCLMPNHYHLVLRPPADEHLSQFMHWLSFRHAHRWHFAHETRGQGHVYQGRFKAIPVQTNTHFVTLCRYVERNPVRAQIVRLAQDWPWSSLPQREGLRRPVRLDPWPVAVPSDWLEMVNQSQGKDETDSVRKSIARGAPFGAADWREQMGTTLGLMGRIRPIGRPRKN
jgi:putative transposase